MSIAIDQDKCIGCGRCHDVCPGTLIKLNENKKAYIKYPMDCWGCTSCLKECPVHAIRFFLGEDIGGRGGRFHVEKFRDDDSVEKLRWILERSDGTTAEVIVNPKESNKY